MKTSLITLSVCLLALTCFSLSSYAQMQPVPRRQPAPDDGSASAPTQPMYYYKDGHRTDLTQDYTFVAISFKNPMVDKAQRHAYYSKIRLVVSELKEKSLLEKGYYVLRLYPGANGEKWVLFTNFMKKDKELQFVGRVFKQYTNDKLVNLLVASSEIQVHFKPNPTKEEINQLEAAYPLLITDRDMTDELITCRVTDNTLDPVDLANRLFETGRYRSVEPVFIQVEGKPVDFETMTRLQQEIMESAPADVKEKMRQKILDEQKKAVQEQQKTEKNKK